MKQLAIIVPYRNRPQHLSRFIGHIEAYFTRDKLDKTIKYTLHIVEQYDDKRFNRGKLKNIGFDLAKSISDYTIFHDIDYLPIWTDYSYNYNPTRLIWYGLEYKEDYETFFGGVVLLPNTSFQTVNGYSNHYESWGFEDADLRNRILSKSLTIDYRDGTYEPLSHTYEGMDENGNWNAETFLNHEM